MDRAILLGGWGGLGAPVANQKLQKSTSTKRTSVDLGGQKV